MENQLTEFIGLTCYDAKRLFGQDVVPQGVIDKILFVAKRGLGISIENTETFLGRFGGQTGWRPPNIVLSGPLIDLKRITSNYFEKKPRSDSNEEGMLFSCTPSFEEKLPLLAEKKYLANFDACVSELLRVWRVEGGLLNLVFLSLLCEGDGGTHALAGDLELMSNEIREYVRTEIYLENRKRAKDPAKVLASIKKTEAALRQKIEILRHAEEYKGRMQRICTSVVGKQILNKTHHFPVECHFWKLVSHLADHMVRIAEQLLKYPSDLPIFQAQVLSNLESSLREISKIAREEGVGPEEGLPAKRIVSLCNKLCEQVDLWNRALVGRYDEEFFARNKRDVPSLPGLHKFVVCFDVKDYTKTVDWVFRERSGSAQHHFDRWRSLLMAIPRNWSILLGGLLANPEGDQEISYFASLQAAIHSMALALVHIELLDSLQEGKSYLRMGLKAGIGSASIIVTTDQEHGPSINYLYHAISKLVSCEAGGRTFALMLEDFLAEHRQMQEFVLETFEFENGNAVRLDYRRIVEQFVGHQSADA